MKSLSPGKNSKIVNVTHFYRPTATVKNVGLHTFPSTNIDCCNFVAAAAAAAVAAAAAAVVAAVVIAAAVVVVVVAVVVIAAVVVLAAATVVVVVVAVVALDLRAHQLPSYHLGHICYSCSFMEADSNQEKS
jgi:hypothetical protein